MTFYFSNLIKISNNQELKEANVNFNLAEMSLQTEIH